MGIMVTNDTDRNSELNRRISSDLRQRVQNSERKPHVNYDDETKKTNRFGWVWIVLIVLAIISLICIAFI